MLALVIGLTIVVALLSVLVAGLLRSHADILRTLHGADGQRSPLDRIRADLPRPAGDQEQAYDIGGKTLRDSSVHVAVTARSEYTLIGFLSSGCLTCRDFWKSAHPNLATTLPGPASLVLVTKDAREESLSELQELAPAGVRVVMSSKAWEDYDVPGSPFFVYVRGDDSRIVGRGTGSGWSQVLNLLSRSILDNVGGLGESHIARERRVDAELAAAGIFPGDPRLYPGGAPTDV